MVNKYKSDQNNNLGLSFIEEDLDNSKFIDDKGFDEIFSTCEKPSKYSTTYMTRKDSMVNNNNLKNYIFILLTQVIPSQNARSTLASILVQLGFTDGEIYKLIGNYRGAISIPYSSNNY